MQKVSVSPRGSDNLVISLLLCTGSGVEACRVQELCQGPAGQEGARKRQRDQRQHSQLLAVAPLIIFWQGVSETWFSESLVRITVYFLLLTSDLVGCYDELWSIRDLCAFLFPGRTEMVTFPALILGDRSSSARYLSVLGAGACSCRV